MDNARSPHGGAPTRHGQLSSHAADPDVLAVLGRIALTLSPERLHDSLDDVLEVLRAALDADTVEMFLADPQSQDMFLVACCGALQTAFCERVCFASGRGYPGLVAAGLHPIVTRDLAADPRFLRHRVWKQGIRSLVCVPLRDGSRVAGSLHAAWRTAPASLENAHRVLEMAALPIGASIRAGASSLQHRVVEAFAASPAPAALEDCLLSALGRMQEVAGFNRGTVLLRDGERGNGVVRVGIALNDNHCPGPTGGVLQDCPCMRQQRCLLFTGSSGKWPAPCRQGSAVSSCVMCVPLVWSGGVLGVVKLGYESASPRPASRFVAAVASMAQAEALQVQLWNAVVGGGRTAALRAGYKPPPVPAGPGWRLEIRCFGRFEVTRNGRPVTPDMFSRRRALTLLKILLLSSGKAVHREVLCDLLWPDSEPRAAANRLHGLVHALREVVEPPAARGRWRVLLSRGEHYSLSLETPHRVDLYEFESAAAEGRALERDPRRAAEAVRSFEAACALYRGDLFEEEPYAEWCWMQRESAREQYLEALKSLARLCAVLGSVERSIEYYRRVLRVDPLREDACQGLMEGLLRCGRRGEALQQYETCASLLRSELGAAPLPDTQRLREQCLQPPDPAVPPVSRA